MLWGAKFSGKVKVKFRKHLNMCASRAFGWLHPLPFHHPNFLGLEFMLWGLESPVEFALHALVQLFCTLSPWFVLFVEINCATLSPQIMFVLVWVGLFQRGSIQRCQGMGSCEGDSKLSLWVLPLDFSWTDLQVSHLFLALGFGLICKSGSFNLCSSRYLSVFPLCKSTWVW